MNKIKTDWNFKLFYKSDTDVQINNDIEKSSLETDKFAKKYSSNKNYLKGGPPLLSALNDFEKVTNQKECIKPLVYFLLRKDTDSSNRIVQSKLNQVQEFYSKKINKTVFFGLELGNIPHTIQNQILKDKKLDKFHYFLKMTFENSKYNLQEGEEKVLNLMSQPSYSMWVNSISRITSQKEINFNNKQIPIEEATSMLVSENYKNRRIIDKKVKEQLATVADFAEAEINAVYTSKKIEDELRGLEKPYSSTVLQYENEEETVENLVKVVTDNAKISKKFYRLKAKMLKQDKLSYCDRAASVGKISRSFDFKETVKILQNSFRKISPKYEEIFNRFLENGQINVYPKKGKSGGAYCFGSIGSPTFVLLNHTNDLNSVTTLAHEMGHAFHTELSNTQDPIYSDYTTSVAEVASTFFENFVFEELMESLTKKEQTIALHDKISGEISTIFRQIACFNFENELHKNIREKGYLAKEEIAKLMNKNMKAYLGPIVKFEEDDGYQFITWSHIRRFFYVYTYASGSLISSALFAKYKEDPKYLEKIEEFLSAGSSKNPEDIFASAGIDIRNPDFFRIGLEKIENDIKKLEKLIG